MRWLTYPLSPIAGPVCRSRPGHGDVCVTRGRVARSATYISNGRSIRCPACGPFRNPSSIFSISGCGSFDSRHRLQSPLSRPGRNCSGTIRARTLVVSITDERRQATACIVGDECNAGDFDLGPSRRLSRTSAMNSLRRLSARALGTAGPGTRMTVGQARGRLRGSFAVLPPVLGDERASGVRGAAKRYRALRTPPPPCAWRLVCRGAACPSRGRFRI